MDFIEAYVYVIDSASTIVLPLLLHGRNSHSPSTLQVQCEDIARRCRVGLTVVAEVGVYLGLPPGSLSTVCKARRYGAPNRVTFVQ